jgi:N utilization substance protein B
MLNRRHIRLKIMQYLYAAEISDFEDTKEHNKNLKNSIHSIHYLYLLQISFLIEILKKARDKYNISQQSVTGNINNRYSNKKFSENIFLNDLASNFKIVELLNSNDFVDWEIDYKYVNIFYDKIINSKIYDSYMESKINSFKEDVKFVYDIFKNLIVTDEKFQTLIEEKNIYWMDDFPLANTLLLKYLKNSTRDNYEKTFHFSLFSNKSDEKYADDLANYSLLNFEPNNELINKYAANWDIERLAKVDLVIINLAISELKEFSDIPVKVTLNEYIEISKDYSTEKSSFFINGILDKVVKDLLKNNSLIKEGRGLRE